MASDALLSSETWVYTNKIKSDKMCIKKGPPIDYPPTRSSVAFGTLQAGNILQNRYIIIIYI